MYDVFTVVVLMSCVVFLFSNLMLCSITGGWFSGRCSHCDSHLLYVVLFWSNLWDRYVLNPFVILYLSLVSIDL